ncbi:hypothetical protein F5X96DRAFT_683663 [Biscogniauxia mediterranea]|nr:hypothetical protein F5X96DRAFT_683663 [Biscogniauxia mediterranea]
MNGSGVRRIIMSIFYISILGSSLLPSARAVAPIEDASISSKQCIVDIPAAAQRDTKLRCPLAIDDGVGQQPVDWSPWTHPPECLEAQDESAQKFCVFTNSQQGNQGISIITKPETAAKSVELLNDQGLWRTRLFTNDTEPAYKIAETPPKGKGVVATRHIFRSEVIMTDWASLILDLSFPSSVRRSQGYELLHRAADQLSDPDRVLQLARSSTTAADIVEDVLRTNAFSYPLAEEPHMAVYPDVSANRVVVISAYVRFSTSNLRVSIIATRDISAGEEISISYIPVNHTRAERQAALKRWGFDCKCSLCTASKAEVAASDYRREKIARTRQQVMDAVEARDGTAAVRLTLEVLDLLRAEELPSLYASQYEILARLYWKAGDAETATRYARASLETLEDQGYLEPGPDNLPALLETFSS